MTLPSNIILPLPNTEDLNTYFRELNYTLQRMYEDLSQGVNGDIQTDTNPDRASWTPILKGTTNAGSFTYTNRSGWTLRQGLVTDCWGDVTWSASGGATGNLYVELPYEVALSNQKPFVGTVQSSAITYTGGTGIVINGIPDTFRGEFWNVGSGFTTARQAVVGSGQLIFHIRYIGKSEEI